MHEINLFCFGFGQVAKKFIQKLLQNKIKVNLITTTRQKTSEVSYFDLKFKNFNVTEHNFDNDLPKEIKKFKKDPSAESHFPANGNASISGVIVDADDKTGLANNISQIIVGGNLNQKF